MSKMKRFLVMWVVALFSIVSVPVVSYVSADPSMDCSTGDCEGRTPAEIAGEWQDAFDTWCFEDGYDQAQCLTASEAFERALLAFLYGQTQTDPRTIYAAYYPGGSKNTVVRPKPPLYTVHPGRVPEPVPTTPTRAPSIVCGCHWGNPTVFPMPA